MTARDEAIEAMAQGEDDFISNATDAVHGEHLLGAILDAIPTGVLAHLVIERGGLVDTTFAQNRNGTVYACSRNWNPDDHGHARLYRLREVDQ